jgi:hypothetical protein
LATTYRRLSNGWLVKVIQLEFCQSFVTSLRSRSSLALKRDILFSNFRKNLSNDAT